MRSLYGSSVYWLETSTNALRPALAGSHEVDVAIVGGGFTGLWTAYHLLEAQPTLNVVVLEGEEIGFGASGRNGGFAMTLLDRSLADLRRVHGDDAARSAHLAVERSVHEMIETVAQRAIECELVHGGLLNVATNRGQLLRIEADLAAAEAMGLDGYRRLSAAEVREEVDSPIYLGAYEEEACAVLHPAKLARGLARVVEGMGAQVFEDAHVADIADDHGKIRITTPDGVVRANQAVLATNAWAADTPWFKRSVMPCYTYIIVTEPISDEQWASVGWAKRQGIEDRRNLIHYFRRTNDGRVLWGGGDLVFHAGRQIRPTYDRHRRIMAELTVSFREMFPQFRRTRITHHWGGAVALTQRLLPLFGTLLDGRLHYGLGYSGHGVAPSHTGGKILRDKVLGKSSELTDLCFVDRREVAFPPDPLLWLGAEFTRRLLRRNDRKMDSGVEGAERDPWILRMVAPS